MSSWLGVGPLDHAGILLRPFTRDDAEAIATVARDPERFRWTTGVPTTLEAGHEFITSALSNPEQRVAFAVVDRTDGRILGSTSYYDIDPDNLCAAVGYTFYGEDVQGTAVNPTAKLLLMRHAFEDCGAVRLVWHTNERNAQSRAAIAKLGATFEGLLRKHRRFGDGWRTTAQYAMIDDDWPAAKEQLLERLSSYS